VKKENKQLVIEKYLVFHNKHYNIKKKKNRNKEKKNYLAFATECSVFNFSK
jgi:hypothetical protein